jgi:hypothetical protein
MCAPIDILLLAVLKTVAPAGVALLLHIIEHHLGMDAGR